jgi:CoA:oxalate CoA-transferase
MNESTISKPPVSATGSTLLSQGPLAGITVIDLSRALAGPYSSFLLAELGARVIKVESPDGGDDSRGFPPFVNGKSIYFSSINRDKQSIALDLKSPHDREIFEGLLETADVLLENFRPGVMKRLGYAWEELHVRFPAIVMASISGFGQSGPYASRTSYDMVAQAMGGIMSITGESDGEPVRVGISIGDIAAGLFSTVGIQSAIVQRQRTGSGSYVDISMLDCQVALLENAVARHLATGETPGRFGSRHPTITPFGAFQAQDGYMAVCIGTESQFRKLMEIIEMPSLADDPRFSSIDARNNNETVFKKMFEKALSVSPRSVWLDRFESAGIPAGPINSVADVVRDPQIQSRQMIVEVHDPLAGPLRFAASPVRISSQDRNRVRRPAPELDADREAILLYIRANPRQASRRIDPA